MCDTALLIDLYFQMVFQYFYFQNETQARDFNAEFCNLTNENATAFASNMLNAVNVTKANTLVNAL